MATSPTVPHIKKKQKWSLPCTEMLYVHEEKQDTGEGRLQLTLLVPKS